MNKFATLGTALLLSFSASAVQEIAGVLVPNNISMAGKTLELQGSGVRSEYFIDLYVGSLFTVEAERNIVASQGISVIRLNIISGLINSEKMVSIINNGFSKATNGNTAAIAKDVSAFIDVFASNIIKGDQFTLVSIPGEGLNTYKNGVLLSTNKDEVFRKAALSIWLGKYPADDELKQSMLGL